MVTGGRSGRSGYHPVKCKCSSRSFYKNVIDLMITQAHGLVICGGDFNLRLNPHWDASGTPTHQNNAFKNLGYCWGKSESVTYGGNSILELRITHLDNSADRSLRPPSNRSRYSKWPKQLFFLEFELEWTEGQILAELEADIQKYLNQNDNGEESPLMVWDACKAAVRERLLLRWPFTRGRDQKN